MRQVLQSYRSGELSLVEVPAPAVQRGGVLIRTRASAISAGTEAQMMQLAKQSLLGKARSRPDLVRRTLQKARTEGVLATMHAVKTKLDVPVTMGYSCAGEVVAVGEGVRDLRVGQRVACAGVGYATHSEYNFVPRNLVNPIPDGVADEDAAFVALGAIALQGLRKGRVQLGEVVAVIGLGLVGQILVQQLLAAGCRVVGADPSEARRHGAAALGATAVPPEAVDAAVREASDGYGADAVMITASTASSEVMIQAAELARLRGRVVVIGFVGMDFPQKPFYEKELEIVFSMSYGPGRYDPAYEEGGQDYPYSLVRWTEGRNMAAVLDLVARGRLDFRRLVTHRYPIERALEAYQMLDRGDEPYLGILLTYAPAENAAPPSRLTLSRAEPAGAVRLGLIGAGDYARSTLIPAIRSAGDAELVGIATATGRSAAGVARKHEARYAATDCAELLRDPAINAVVIATRHGQHAEQVIAALAAGKHVFVEKPLCLTFEQLAAVQQAYEAADGRRLLHVGHNRRFSPAFEQVAALFAQRRSPMVLNFRINLGPMDPDHWHRDGRQGGGRWLGEGSHFVDFAVAAVGAVPERVFATGAAPRGRDERGESYSVTLTFPDSSVATISYCDLGDRSLPKERCELFADGKAAVIDDFSRVELFAAGRHRRIKTGRDKGHRTQMQRFCERVRDGGPALVPFHEQLQVVRATLLAELSRRRGESLRLDEPGGDAWIESELSESATTEA